MKSRPLKKQAAKGKLLLSMVIKESTTTISSKLLPCRHTCKSIDVDGAKRRLVSKFDGQDLARVYASSAKQLHNRKKLIKKQTRKERRDQEKTHQHINFV